MRLIAPKSHPNRSTADGFFRGTNHRRRRNYVCRQIGHFSARYLTRFGRPLGMIAGIFPYSRPILVSRHNRLIRLRSVAHGCLQLIAACLPHILFRRAVIGRLRFRHAILHELFMRRRRCGRCRRLISDYLGAAAYQGRENQCGDDAFHRVLRFGRDCRLDPIAL
jgi:hypothetical protein